MEPFLLRALAAAAGLAVVAAPLGCIVLWGRMAYFGEALAQAGLLGVALGLMLQIDMTLAVLFVAIAFAGLLVLFGQQQTVPLDSILGLFHHGALAAGVIATALVRGPSVDLLGYLFGDIFAVTRGDLVWVFAGGTAVLLAVAWLWQPLLRVAVHDELAAAEGIDAKRLRAMLILMLAVTIAVAMKIVGILLIIAFLIVPAVAARPFSASPERMVLLSALIAAGSVAAGLGISTQLDVPGGPAIVLVMAFAALFSLTASSLRGTR